MKKILSFVLVLAMIASMMCISVSAAGTSSYTNNDFIGSNDTADGEGGVDYDDADKTVTGITVDATVSSKTISKYAVDLTYSVSDITVYGTATWNVNTLRYDGSEITVKTAYSQNQEKGDVPANNTDIKVGTFTLTNYSDKGVTVTPTVAPHANVPISGEIKPDAGSSFNVPGAYDNQTTSRAKIHNYTAFIKSSDWVTAVAQLNLQGGSTVTVATITFAVTPLAEDAPQG